MKPTHILITIKDIEELDKKYTKDAYWKHVMSALIEGKQISLDEQNIGVEEHRRLLKLAFKDFESTNTKFIKGTDKIIAANDWVRGYKQALKDLL